jgi:2-methylcitrate dehydratase PrpD
MITEKLASIVIDIDYDKLPEEVIFKAKQCFTDFLGVALAGSKTHSSKIVKNIFNNGDGSSVLGSRNVSCMDASLVNGVFAHSLDLDDGHRFAQLHPGCSVIPAALSVTEIRNKTGQDFISSIVAGYQISILMGMISNPEHRTLGFHSTGTCGTFGATAASCKAIDLGFEDTVNALGLAGTQSAGLLESDHAGSSAKHLHAGKAAQAGVISAILSENGFKGAPSIIDGKEGFLNAMVIPSSLSTSRTINYDNRADKLISTQNYHILDVYFKKYPVCRHLHSTIDAAVDIYNQMGSKLVDVDDITSIHVKTYEIASQHDNYNPNSVEAVRQSLPVAIAITLLNGDLNINNVSVNQKIIALASKVVLEHDEEMDAQYPSKRPSKVIVSTENDFYTCQVDLPMGEPECPLEQNEILKKFNYLNPNVDLDVLEIIDELESYKMKDLMKILNKGFHDSCDQII